MRFITEFESTYECYGEPAFDRMYKAYKGKGALDIGNEIADVFGWKVDEQRFKVHTSLEIEAFPMEKWIEFKQKLFTHIYEEGRRGVVFNQVRVFELIKELESFGKPAGEANELNQKNNG